MASRTKFAGQYRALDYFYGGPNQNNSPAPLLIKVGNSVAGAGSCSLKTGVSTLTDGTQMYPLATSAPILVGSGSNQETVTPTSVTNPTSPILGVPSFAAVFANAHGIDDPVASASAGLQEALNDASLNGGGTVIVDAAWRLAGGTTAMITAAVVPGGVAIADNRYGGPKAASPLLTVNGAINPRVSASYVITKGSVWAGTLAAPTAVIDDGVLIDITSSTAFAHTLTATALFKTGTAAVNLATWPTFAGATLRLRAYNGLWHLNGAPSAVVMS